MTSTICNSNDEPITTLSIHNIPIDGTHSFTAQYKYNQWSGGFIGVARAGLTSSMGGKGGWALESNGYVCLDSFSMPYFNTHFKSNSTVTVTVNIMERWL